MHFDKEGLMAIGAGLAILAVMFVFVYGGLANPLGAIISMVVDALKGAVIVFGVLLLLVGILFMLAW